MPFLIWCLLKEGVSGVKQWLVATLVTTEQLSLNQDWLDEKCKQIFSPGNEKSTVQALRDLGKQGLLGECFWRCWGLSMLVTFWAPHPKRTGEGKSKRSEVKQMRHRGSHGAALCRDRNWTSINLLCLFQLRISVLALQKMSFMGSKSCQLKLTCVFWCLWSYNHVRFPSKN